MSNCQALPSTANCHGDSTANCHHLYDVVIGGSNGSHSGSFKINNYRSEHDRMTKPIKASEQGLDQ
jgi:hypothetical protein